MIIISSNSEPKICTVILQFKKKIRQKNPNQTEKKTIVYMKEHFYPRCLSLYSNSS